MKLTSRLAAAVLWVLVTSTAAQARERVFYYHNDYLGTPQVMTDQTGAVVWSAEYEPFGRATVTTSTITNNLRFPGQYYDAETGLHYNWHRDYDPETGRYLQPDPIGLEGGLNLYPYVDGNPVSRVDPEGLTAIPWQLVFPAAEETLGALIGAAVGAAAAEKMKQMCDPCRPYELDCIGKGKNVQKHVSPEYHLHPKPCKDLQLSIINAGVAGCGGRPGVQFGVTVYNTHCTRDWSGQYPNHTPHFPPF